MKKWELLNRRKVYSSKFVNLYMDKVKLHNGKIINDFSVIEKPSYVIVVATDNKNRVITLKEYKHGAGEFLSVLPAGHKKKNESAIEAGKRELLEETGFVGSKFKFLGILHDYSSKDIHKGYVVRAVNVKLSREPRLEETEGIADIILLPASTLKKHIIENKWKDSSDIAALALAGILF